MPSFLLRLVGIFLLMSSGLAIAQSNQIPQQAYTFRETIRNEIEVHWEEIPNYNYIPALIEHESCITLKHKKCWNSQSRLKTSREEGAGLGQITRAWRADGSLRFDSLEDLRTRYKAQLKEAKWETIYNRPDLQIRMILLMSRDNYRSLYDVPDEFQRLAMSDAAYNGGMGHLRKERRLCGYTRGCDPFKWFGHVEKMVVKSTKALYGKRSAYEINRYHVSDVLKIRMPKYDRAGYF